MTACSRPSIDILSSYTLSCMCLHIESWGAYYFGARKIILCRCFFFDQGYLQSHNYRAHDHDAEESKCEGALCYHTLAVHIHNSYTYFHYPLVS